MVNDEYSADTLSITSIISPNVNTGSLMNGVDADPDGADEDDLSSNDDEYVQN